MAKDAVVDPGIQPYLETLVQGLFKELYVLSVSPSTESFPFYIFTTSYLQELHLFPLRLAAVAGRINP